ncbi:MAG: response regulator [Parcubacteria group bacterium]|nr:response regulator [Parcubacteria group bacterium]
MADTIEQAVKKQILLVEDEQFLSALLKNRLEKEGFEVILARDGEEAVNILKTAKPTLVLLDLILPKMSGLTFWKGLIPIPSSTRGR